MALEPPHTPPAIKSGSVKSSDLGAQKEGPKEGLEGYTIIVHPLNHKAHGEWVMPRIGVTHEELGGGLQVLEIWGLESKEDKWILPAASACPSPLPKAHHVFYRYYHTLFTHSLPEALKTIANEIPTCVDVLMNFLVATVTKLPPIKVPYGRQHLEAAPMVSCDSRGWFTLGKSGMGGGGGR